MNAMSVAKSYYHRGGNTPLLGSTIFQHFSSIVQRYADREAVVCIPQKQRLTYQELSAEVDLTARGLIAVGINRGDKIGIWSTNNLQWIFLQLATARIGAVLVNINPAYREHELEYALKQSKVKCLVCIPSFKNTNYIEMLIDLLPELCSQPADRFTNSKLPDLVRIILFDPNHPMATILPAKGFTLWQDLLESAEHIDQQRLDSISDSLDRDDVINIQYTSGTTGFPKAVMLTHHNILNNAWFSAQAMHFSESDRLCVTVPFYHCFGMVLANLLCFSVGACAVIACEHFDVEAVLQSIQQEKCTAIHGVPTMFIAELEHPDFATYDLSSLRTGIMAGAPCPTELMLKVMERMHCTEILIGYGETEASPLTHLTTPEDTLYRRTQTVGRNLPHQEVKVIDIASGNTVALDNQGEICFRGYHLMRGYFGNEEATRQTIDDKGWLHSGDVGKMDQDGYVTITGRLKEMIIRGGENIYPREIEDLLFTHPKISAVAVFGIPDDFYGEQVAAWIRLQENVTCTEEEIRSFCESELSYYKVPKYIRFVTSFPMTVTGKIQKYKMRELMLESLKSYS